MSNGYKVSVRRFTSGSPSMTPSPCSSCHLAKLRKLQAPHLMPKSAKGYSAANMHQYGTVHISTPVTSFFMARISMVNKPLHRTMRPMAIHGTRMGSRLEGGNKGLSLLASSSPHAPIDCFLLMCTKPPDHDRSSPSPSSTGPSVGQREEGTAP